MQDTEHEFVKIIDSDTLQVTTTDFRGSVTNKITRQDVLEYCENINSMSGLRSLGSIDGDWRMIDQLAGILSDVFSQIEEVSK